jgi:hypothetical protein
VLEISSVLSCAGLVFADSRGGDDRTEQNNRTPVTVTDCNTDVSLIWTCQFKYPVQRGDCSSPMSSRRSGFYPRAFCVVRTVALLTSAASQKLQLRRHGLTALRENNRSLCDVTWLCATEWRDNYCTLMCFQFMYILFLCYCWLAFIEAVNIGQQQQQQQQHYQQWTTRSVRGAG